MTFFERIRQRADPRLSAREVSDELNAFEVMLFRVFPEALTWPEASQNDFILTAYRRHRQSTHSFNKEAS